jgi:1,4-dihydroxy-6-naphthoate synthase
MKLSLGFSPCPNDTFIFDALVNKKIDTGDLEFEVFLEDVETLNQWALEGKLDITKLSFPAFFQAVDKYILLNSGSALGKGVGPLLVSNSDHAIPDSDVKNYQVALPGVNTTANLLFSFAFPNATNKTFMRFDKIEDFVITSADAAVLGVIIHENRFTYQQKNLYKVADLGELWESKMNSPIPLGGIAISQSVKRSLAIKVEDLIKKSLEYAFENYPEVSDYVKEHAQTMSEDVMKQHIDLYVNNYSLDIGNDGQAAIEKLYEVYLQMNDKVRDDEDVLFL